MIVGLVFAMPIMAAESAKTMRVINLEHNPNQQWDSDAYAQIIFEDWGNWSLHNNPPQPQFMFKIRVNDLSPRGGVKNDQNAEWSAQASYVLNIYDSNKNRYRIFTFNTGRNGNYDVDLFFNNSPNTIPYDPINDELFIEISMNDDDGIDTCGWCEVEKLEDLPSWVVLFAHVPVSSQVNIVGPEEIVFDWSTDSCEMEDIPDLPARAFRDADGKVQLIATHFINRRMIGDDLASVKRDCNIIMTSDMDADPSQYNDREWIAALYTLDGVNIHAIVHNEYEGHTHPGMCPSGNPNTCWYNSLTYASSMDKGLTYTHAPAPQHRVANIPYIYEGNGPRGIFEPSNIIQNPKDGYYYMFVNMNIGPEHNWGVGVMRTQTLEDPASWRCWDGEGFNITFIDPYTEQNYNPADHICKQISKDNIEIMHSSVTYNKFFNKFLLVGSTGLWDPNIGETIYGFYYSLSDDLINWSPRQLIMKAKLSWTPFLPGDIYAYPSLIDPDDKSMNFEYTDNKVYLYYTRWHEGTMYDRDLIRIPIEFTIQK